MIEFSHELDVSLEKQNQAFRVILTKVCNRMVMLESEVEHLKQQIRQDRESLEQQVDVKIQALYGEFQSEIGGVTATVEEKQAENDVRYIQVNDKIEMVDDAVRLLQQAEGLKKERTVQTQIERRWDEPHRLYIPPKEMKQVSELIPFTIPATSDDKLENRIKALEAADFDRREFLDVCNYAQSFNRSRVYSLNQPKAQYEPKNISARLAESERSIQILYELLRVSAVKTTGKTVYQTKIVEIQPYSAQQQINAPILVAPAPQIAVKIDSMPEQKVFSEMVRHGIEKTDEAVFHTVKAKMRVFKAQIPSLRHSLSELSSTIRCLRQAKYISHPVRDILVRVKAAVDAAYETVSAESVDLPQAEVDLMQIVHVIYTALQSQNDLGSDRVEVFRDSVNEFTAALTKVLSTKLSGFAKQLLAMENRLSDITTPKPSKIVSSVQSSEVKKIGNITRGTKEYSALLASLKTQLGFELGLHRSKTETRDLHGEMRCLQEQINQLQMSMPSMKSLALMERKFSSKVDKDYVDRIMGTLTRPHTSNLGSERWPRKLRTPAARPLQKRRSLSSHVIPPEPLETTPRRQAVALQALGSPVNNH